MTFNVKFFNRTLAHELGHGAFTYEHPFDNAAYKTEQGATRNLMDYVTDDDLAYFQWQSTLGLNLTWGFLEGDEDAMKLVTDAKKKRVTSVKKDEYFIVADDDAREKDATTLADVKPKKKLPVGAELQAQEDKDGGGVAKFKFVAIVADAANNPNRYVADGNNSTVVYTSMGNLLKVHSCSKKMKLTKNLTTSDIYKLPYSNVNVASDLDVSSYTKGSYVDVDYKCEDYFRIKENNASEGSGHVEKWVKSSSLLEQIFYVLSEDADVYDATYKALADQSKVTKSTCVTMKEMSNKNYVSVKSISDDDEESNWKCIKNQNLQLVIFYQSAEEYTFKSDLKVSDFLELPYSTSQSTNALDESNCKKGSKVNIIASCGSSVLVENTLYDGEIVKGAWVKYDKFNYHVSVEDIENILTSLKVTDFTIPDKDSRDYNTLNELVDSDPNFSDETIKMVGGAVNRGGIKKEPIEGPDRKKKTEAVKNVLIK
ncbi:MAG: hypothetical protein MJZ34_08940 [Paludibacteraceae bacterium]|nr:hypothetical protein [Paludibacteraceae bacterium]